MGKKEGKYRRLNISKNREGNKAIKEDKMLLDVTK